jgi:hypothetical protein
MAHEETCAMRKFRRGASFVKHVQCSTRLDRNDKARIIYLAEKTELRTKAKGRKAGAIGQGGLQVLRCLLHQFHNTSTGQCDPVRVTAAPFLGSPEPYGSRLSPDRFFREKSLETVI